MTDYKIVGGKIIPVSGGDSSNGSSVKSSGGIANDRAHYTNTGSAPDPRGVVAKGKATPSTDTYKIVNGKFVKEEKTQSNLMNGQATPGSYNQQTGVYTSPSGEQMSVAPKDVEQVDKQFQQTKTIPTRANNASEALAQGNLIAQIAQGKEVTREQLDKTGVQQVQAQMPQGEDLVFIRDTATGMTGRYLLRGNPEATRILESQARSAEASIVTPSDLVLYGEVTNIGINVAKAGIPLIVKSASGLSKSQIPNIFTIGSRGAVNVASQTSNSGIRSIALETPEVGANIVKNKLLSGGTNVGIGAIRLTSAENAVMQTALKSQLTTPALISYPKVLQGINLIPTKNIGGALITGAKQSIYETGAQYVGRVGLSQPVIKEGARFVGAQAISQGLYFTSQQTVPVVRGMYASGNKFYKEQEDVVKIIPEGYGLSNVQIAGGNVPLVDETGKPLLDEKGVQQYQSFEGVKLNPLESFIVGTVPSAQVISLGEKGLFGTGFFSEETRKKRIEGLETKIKTTESYKSSLNKEQFLAEAINTEFFGAQIGAGLAIPQYEAASEIGISSLGKIVQPGIMSKFSGRGGLGLTMAVITPFYGASEGITTQRVTAESMRTKLTPKQEFDAAAQGAIMATAINVATGITMQKAKSPFPVPEGKFKSQAIYYGAKGVGYGFDLPELVIDKALDVAGTKKFLGINMSIPVSTFVGAPTTSPGTLTKTNIKAPSSTQDLELGAGSLININSKSSNNTDTGTNSNNNTSNNSDSIVNNFINTYNNANSETNTSLNTETSSNTEINSPIQISTIVSPQVPFPPFFPFGGDSTPFSTRGSGKKRTKYYNELEAAGRGLSSLDLFLGGRVKSKKTRSKRSNFVSTGNLGKAYKSKNIFGGRFEIGSKSARKRMGGKK